MRYRRLLVVALLLGAPLSASRARPGGSIELVVQDAVSGEPVRDAAVVVEPGRRIATTGADGRIALSGLAPGSYRIEVSHVAYLAASPPPVTIVENGTVRIEVRLDRNPVRETLTVRSGPPLPEGAAGAGTISRDEMSGLPGTLDDPARALTAVPGVGSVNDFKGDIRIHGGEPEDTLFNLDGVTVEDPYHFRFTRASISGLNLDAFDAFRVESVGLASRIGDTVSGVVDLSPTERGREGMFTSATVGTLAVRATSGGPVGDGSWVVAGRYSSLALYRDLYDVRNMSLPTFKDLLLRTRAPIGSRVELVAGSLLLGNDLQTSDPNDHSSTDLAGSSGLVYAGLDATLGTRLRLVSRLAMQRSSQRAKSSEGDDVAGRERRAALAVELVGGDEERPAWRLGLTQLSLAGDYFGAIQTVGDLPALDAHTARTGAHAEVDLRPSARWTIEAGARIDHDVRVGTTPIQPRIAVRHVGSSGLTASLSVSRYAQFPRFEQEFLALGTPLGISTADEVSAGASLPLGHGVALDLTAFARRLVGTAAETVNRFPDLPEPMAQFERGSGRGLDVAIRKEAGRFRSRLALGLLQAQEVLDGRASPTNGDQPFRVDLSAAWLLTSRWDLSSRLQVASGLPYSALEPTGGGGRVLGPLNGARLPTYARLDLRGSWAFAPWKGRGRLFLEIDNVLRRDNVRGQELRYDPADGLYYQHYDTGMPLVPAFGVEISWGGR